MQCMKPYYALCLLGVAAVLVFCAGCAGTSSPAATPVPTTPVVSVTTATPTPTATPYPGALSLGADAPFGIGGKTGSVRVYKADLMADYSWTSPSFNSPSEQRLTGEALETQKGYNTQKPSDGNAFLFVFVKLTDTGSDSIVAPSPAQFMVNYNGNNYQYQSLPGPDVSIGGVRGTQYDYVIGKGGVSGYILPGESNAADGFLIYEVPASIDLTKASMVITLDAQHTTAWQLG
jgi:hypothetical protein